MITFVAEGRGCNWTDLSYHVPAFSEIWVEYAKDGREGFYRECPDVARKFPHRSGFGRRPRSRRIEPHRVTRHYAGVLTRTRIHRVAQRWRTFSFTPNQRRVNEIERELDARRAAESTEKYVLI